MKFLYALAELVHKETKEKPQAPRTRESATLLAISEVLKKSSILKGHSPSGNPYASEVASELEPDAKGSTETTHFDPVNRNQSFKVLSQSRISLIFTLDFGRCDWSSYLSPRG